VLEMYYHKDIDHDVSETLVRQSLQALKDKGLDAINLSWPEPVPPVVAGRISASASRLRWRLSLPPRTTWG